MPPPGHPSATPTHDLRAALLAPPPVPTSAPRPAPERSEPAAASPPPTAPELLGSSRSVQRLCESYHRTYTTMVNRGRRQRIGLGLLVAAIGCGAAYLKGSGLLNASIVTDMVVAVAGGSLAGLAVLALLWVRDERRLRSAQGERLLRALQFNCDLPNERLAALRSGVASATAAFYDCYAEWRAEHHTARQGLFSLFGSRGSGAAA